MSANYKKRDLSALICSMVMSETATVEQIFDLLREKRLGTFVSFHRMQRKDKSGGETKWSGPGEAHMLVDGEVIIVSMQDDEARSITIANYQRIRTNPSYLSECLKQLGLKTPREQQYSRRAVARFNETRFALIWNGYSCV